MKSAIYEVLNVGNVDVDLASGITKIHGDNINVDAVVDAIESSGYYAKLVK